MGKDRKRKRLPLCILPLDRPTKGTVKLHSSCGFLSPQPAQTRHYTACSDKAITPGGATRTVASRLSGGPIPPFGFNEKKTPVRVSFFVGGATRNRTGDEGFADLCLTAWLWRHHKLQGREDSKKADANVCDSHPQSWSGLRGSNPPPRPWQGRALPNELNPHWCLRSELNQRHGDFQSPALPTELQRQTVISKKLKPIITKISKNGDPKGVRTPDLCRDRAAL